VVKSIKIGESAVGGIIRVSTRPRGVFEVQCLDYQDKSVVVWRFCHGYDELYSYLSEVTTHYYAEKFVSHFKQKLNND